MIRREYKGLKLFLVIVVALISTWQGKKNLAWLVSQVSGAECTPTWIFVNCR